MASVREIRTKIKGIKSVTQVTRTMKLVSSVKFAKAQSAVANARPFARGIEDLVKHIACGCDHPFFELRDNGKTGILLVTADRGLCGSFNVNLAKKCMEFVQQRYKEQFVFCAAGRKGRDYLLRQEKKLRNEYTGIFRNLKYTDAEKIADELINTFMSGDVSSVWAVYSEFEGAGRQREVVTRLLPVEREKQEKTAQTVEEIFEPAKELLFDALLRRYFRAKIFRILLESSASEQYARMTAMDMATKNANEIIDDLTLEMNKLRQMNITKELSEIIGAAEALNK